MTTPIDPHDELVGIRYDETIEAYHKGPGLSATCLKYLEETPADLRAYLDGKLDESTSESEARRKGRLTHLLLESELSGRPVTDKIRAVEGRWAGKIKEEVEALRANGMEVCKPEELELSKLMCASVLSKKKILQFLQDGYSEPSLYWKHPEFGFLCKMRPDYLRKDAAISDFKVVTDVSDDAWKMLVKKRRWLMQTAWYLFGASIITEKPQRHFVHIAIKDSYPFHVRAFEAGDNSLERVRQYNEQLCQRYAESQATGIWKGYDDDITGFELEFYERG